MTLRTLFAIPIAVILLATLSLAGLMAGQGLLGYQRGHVAILAVERMRSLVMLQTDLWAERVYTSAALGQPNPLPDAALRRLTAARRETDLTVLGLIAKLNSQSPRIADPETFFTEFTKKLGLSRGTVDGLLARDRTERTYQEMNSVFPRMLAASLLVEQPLARASLDVAAADPALSGLLAVARLAASLRDGVSRIPAVLMPRFNTARALTAKDVEEVNILLARTALVTKLLRGIIEILEPADRMLAALVALEEIEAGGVRTALVEIMDAGRLDAHDQAEGARTQRWIIPWSERVNALREAIVDRALEKVTAEQHARVYRLWMVTLASMAVVMAVLVSLALLRWRVVGPLARLGIAIARIADGDRATPLTLRSATREIAEMVTAVETLRQAALVADATGLRQRMAARQRLLTLREALGIVLTVEEPAKALEHGVACLSEGIDTAIALVTTPACVVPLTLGAAANAVRLGLAEMRGSAADLNATIAAARTAQTDDTRPEAEIVAQIMAVQDHVGRRDAAVRGFIQPSLVALRDAASAGGGGLALRDLVRDQFQRIESTVATVSSMRAQAARAAAIVRDLPLEDTKLAA
ncbi:MAG: hypothetical protein EXR07_00270 [Acetobacteraceae bacterium]|nr:hypothetical protein [Acetobacteraceae bacterium]